MSVTNHVANGGTALISSFSVITEPLKCSVNYSNFGLVSVASTVIPSCTRVDSVINDTVNKSTIILECFSQTAA